MPREAADMELVYYGLGKWSPKRQIALPIVSMRIDDNAFHGRGAVITGQRRSPALVCIRHRDSETVRVEKHLIGIEPQSTVRRKGSMCPIRIHLAYLQARHKGMPVMIRAVLRSIERDDLRWLHGIFVLEEKQFHHDRTLRE